MRLLSDLSSIRTIRNFGTLARWCQLPGPQKIHSTLVLHFSSTTNQADDGWNTRAKEYLEKSLGQENDSDGTDVAKTLQTLLDDMLDITAASAAGQKGEYKNSAAYDMQSQANQNAPYLDWIPLSRYSSEDIDSSESHAPSSTAIHEAIDVGLAFALMDRLVVLEQDENSALINHTVEWTSHTSCLNPILQLWKRSYSPVRPDRNGETDSILSPSEVLAKLDSYRQKSNLLIPDVQSYNIILDAVATHGNSRENKRNKSKVWNNKSTVDIDFCRSLWEWMWKESNQDSLVRPDEITLRILLKAHIFTGDASAAQRCEELVDEWTKQHRNDGSSHSSESGDTDVGQQAIHDPRGTLLQALVHVWALHDPQIAESYLKELAWRYLSGKSLNPPDTIAWNRVISAYSIAYNRPDKGLEVLESFWEFYRKAHGLDESTLDNSTTAVDVEKNSDSSSINTRSNSLKLSNAIAVSTSKEDSGISEDVPRALDSAIWKVHQPNLQTYNALLEGYARQKNVREANKIFDRVQNASSISPDIATYTSAIKANASELEKVNEVAQQCLSAFEEQELQQGNASEEEGQLEMQKHIVLDRPFFHAWLNACANAQNIKNAKKVMKQMKSFNLKSNATTYRLLIDVFLSSMDSQGAIEWLLAYAKLEGMSENAIVACTTHLLQWYRNNNQESSSGDVDSMVLLQILCENGYITQEEALQQLLLGISGNQAKSVMGWLGRTNISTSLKMWAIAIRGLAQEGADAVEVENLLQQLKKDPSWAEKFDPENSSIFDQEEEKLIVEIYSSIIVSWSKQGRFNRQVKRRINHWKNELNSYREGALSLNLAAQVALVTMYCDAGDPLSSEEYVNDLFREYEEGKNSTPPDTIMCNMVLNAWSKKNNGSRAAAFFENRIKEPDDVSYNTVINAFAKQGQLEKAEEWASALIDSFTKNPVESLRPKQSTFTVLLAGWRRSKHPEAAERAQKTLEQMLELHETDVLLSKPNAKSYQTVLDTWEKSNRLDAAQRAEELILSSSEFKADKKLLKKVRYIKSKHEKRIHTIQES